MLDPLRISVCILSAILQMGSLIFSRDVISQKDFHSDQDLALQAMCGVKLFLVTVI